MDFKCQCHDTLCYCVVDVYLTAEEQDEIILARIMGEALHNDLRSHKLCEQCTSGWHLYNPDTGKRSKKVDKVDATNKG